MIPVSLRELETFINSTSSSSSSSEAAGILRCGAIRDSLDSFGLAAMDEREREGMKRNGREKEEEEEKVGGGQEKEGLHAIVDGTKSDLFDDSAAHRT